METSNSKMIPDQLGVKGRVLGVIDMLFKPTLYPLYLLFLIFLLYAFVDLVATFIEFGEVDGWLMAQYHFIAGYLICSLYFKLVLPEFINHKRRIRAVFYFLLLFSSLVAVKLLVHNVFLGTLSLSKSFLVIEFTRLFHFLILTSVVWAYYNNLELGKSKYAVEINHEKLKVMHRSMQLSSHFVLNSLSIYQSKIIKLSPDLAREFSHLTSLLRYSFKELGEPNFLNEEVKAVGKYLQIQSMRFPQLSLHAAIDVPSIADKLPMPKMCLLTLVENVFFHGDYTDTNHPCKIEFLLVQEDLTAGWVFKVNITNKVQNRGIKPRSGFGSSSVFRVLGHEFGDGFHYRVESDESNYSLLLRIHYGKTIQSRSD
ncbi:histidine kinase [Algoriphagus sp. AGSA1]|uniref:histidine kinase n=1 Tax=unclassified Algoriphagus TaxID=2641541 RepID=UPI00177EC357|nr:MULTISPECIES: histidine kinase [unclassified Algoriphagus]MCE7057589.1 histidine kinase [Algoriphagus sp. AGSA1]